MTGEHRDIAALCVPWPDWVRCARCRCCRGAHGHHYAGEGCGLCDRCARFTPRLADRLRLAVAMIGLAFGVLRGTR